MVIPQSHEKVWSNWSPPRLDSFAKGDADSDIQRDVLNKIIETLRSNIVAQVLKCSQPAAWHADSVTGLTALGTFICISSLSPVTGIESLNGADDDVSESTDHWTSESEPGSSSPSPNSFVASSPTQGGTKATSTSSQGEPTARLGARNSDEENNDDDDDGGVAL